MAKFLTPRQREALDAIKNYVAENGYPPSIRELRETLGVSSLRGVTIHLDALQKKGWIQRESTSRSIRILAPIPPNSKQQSSSVPLLGSIAAGAPLLAVEHIEGYVSVPNGMISGSDELFALRVKGDSMIGDHILDGDIIIVKSQNTADNGSIIAALIGDGATVKRLDTQASPPRLLPSNPDYEPIELAGEDVRILGIVAGLIRPYNTPNW